MPDRSIEPPIVSRPSREIVAPDNGEIWIIEGHPGNYRARLAGPLTVDRWQHKYELRRLILDGQLSIIREEVES